MNEKPYPRIRTSTLVVLLAGASLALPMVACEDDDRIEPIDGGDGSGGEPSSGGKVGSGGAASGGKIGSGGAGGGVASGGASSGGASSGGASSGGASSGGSGLDASDDGGDDGGVGCSGALDPNKANLCLTFVPEAVTANPADVQLNGVGTLVVQVFDTAFPAGPANLLGQTVYPAPPSATPPYSEQVSINSLPQLGFANLPDTVYVRAFFVDNPTWFPAMSGLRYGMQVGGINLNNGIRPANTPPQPPGIPPIRAVTLTKGQETAFDLRMYAMKKFTATVMKFPGAPANPPDPAKPPVVPADDGQGNLSVGVFTERAASGALLFGGVEAGCVDISTPVTVSGFFYNTVAVPTGGTQMWFGAQVNDFNLTVAPPGVPPGSLVSIVLEGTPEVQVLPPTQHAQVMPGQYSVVLDPLPNTSPSPLFLTTVAPGLPTTLPPSYQCPVPEPVDAGGD